MHHLAVLYPPELNSVYKSFIFYLSRHISVVTMKTKCATTVGKKNSFMYNIFM